MSKSSYFDITDQSIKDGILAGTGAGVMFFVQRFFKNNDSLSERVRRLENQHTRIEMQIKNLDKYVHHSVHDLKNMINEKTLKDAVVDQVHEIVKEINGKLDEHKEK